VTVTSIDSGAVPIQAVPLPAGPGSTITITPTGPLAAGGSYPFVLHCTLDKSAPLGPLTNTATAQAPGGQPVSKSVTIQISNAQPLLTLSKTVDRASAKFG